MWGFNHMHLSCLSPQQTAPGRCLYPLSGNACPYNPITQNSKSNIPSQTQKTGELTQLLNMSLFLLKQRRKVHSGFRLLTGLGGWRMSALPEVSSHIADIVRQLNSPGVGCITKKKTKQPRTETYFTLSWSS